ncbi:MAG TPA: hypothetical protein VFE37_29785 [Chloroflexota bacterium]|nr:hypothetical protein [Chloroflexota bacterium]
MAELTATAGDAGIEELLQKLGAFRGTLSARERQMLDAMLVAAAGGAEDDVQGYAFTTVVGRQVALAALLALGITVGGLSPLAAGAAQAAPLDQQSLNVSTGGSLGFRLPDTPMREQLQRHGMGTERDLVWTAEFTSRWQLNQDQLDRWSAQAVGLIADQLGSDVRLAGYERLDASDVGELQVAYRYQLTSASGQPVGEATIVVFARGDRVGMTGTGAIGTRAPADAASLARVLDATAARG